MTTLVGLVANKGKKGVILASDLSRTNTFWITEGDFAYKHQTKQEAKKILLNETQNVAVAMTGVYDELYMNFLDKLVRGQIDVEKAVKDGFFPELNNMNQKRWEFKIPHEQYNSLLIATKFGEPKLYTCWPLGKVEERWGTSIGSGSKYALEYLHSQKAYQDLNELDLETGVELAFGSLDAASQDIYTGGVDLVVLTADKIHEYGSQIKRAIDVAKKSAIRKIKFSLR